MTTANEELDILKFIGKAILFIKKKIYIVIIFIVLGLLTGLYVSFNKKNDYELIYTLKSNVININVLEEMAFSFSENINNNQSEILIKKMNTRENVISKIKHMNVDNFDNDENKDFIKLHFFVENVKLLDTFSIGIKNYFNTSYYKNKIEFQKNQMDTLLGIIQEEIKEFNNESKTISGINVLDINEVLLPEQRIINLYKEKQQLERGLEFLSPIIIVDKEIKYPDNQSFSVIDVFKYGIIFLFIGLLCIFIYKFISVSISSALNDNH